MHAGTEQLPRLPELEPHHLTGVEDSWETRFAQVQHTGSNPIIRIWRDNSRVRKRREEGKVGGREAMGAKADPERVTAFCRGRALTWGYLQVCPSWGLKLCSQCTALPSSCRTKTESRGL